MKKEYYKNPKIDYLIYFIGGEEVPTKQDDYKPVEFIDENDNIINGFYEKKPDKSNVKKFREFVKNFFDKNQIEIIKKPDFIEVLISVSTKSIKRFNEIDVDNISKNVLDSLKGFAFEEDAQVTYLYCNKIIQTTTERGLSIAVTNLKDGNNERGLLSNIKLISDDPKYFE